MCASKTSSTLGLGAEEYQSVVRFRGKDAVGMRYIPKTWLKGSRNSHRRACRNGAAPVSAWYDSQDLPFDTTRSVKESIKK
ncbi:MAG: hypothetical protein IPI39_21280 [Candidatus Obscuribacter sp.]|nr:hypothetical protein [Candidatus Obscuribacter sp.]